MMIRPVLDLAAPIAGTVMLSQLPAPGESQLYSVLGVVVCVMGIYYLGRQIVLSHSRTPPVDQDLRAMEQSLGERIEGAITRLDERRARNIRDLHTKIEETGHELGERIGHTEQEVARLDADVKSLIRQDAAMDQKITTLLSRPQPTRTR